MTHVYPAGGSRRVAVFTAIIGLHVAVLLLVLNDQVPVFPVTTGQPGPVTLLPQKPLPPVIVPPDRLQPLDPLGEVVAEPEFSMPVFLTDDASGSPIADGRAPDGVLPTPEVHVVRTRASLQGLGGDFAAVVRACYPAGARRDSEEGLLKLAVTIGTGGQVVSWRLAESTGFPRLDAAAQCVLDKLRFNAARDDGRAVQSEVILPIVFRLD